MGYSCTRDAQDTLAAISHKFATDGNPNVWTIGTVQVHEYFFERGEENEDGAITGQLMQMLPDNFARPVGSVRIDADGTIARFPKLIAADRRAIEELARKTRATNPQWISSWRVPL